MNGPDVLSFGTAERSYCLRNAVVS